MKHQELKKKKHCILFATFLSLRLFLCDFFFCVSLSLSRSARVVDGPDGDELAQVVRAQDGGVPGEVVEVVHDDGHEQVEHDEGAEEDEGDEVDVGQVGAAVPDVDLAGLGDRVARLPGLGQSGFFLLLCVIIIIINLTRRNF